MLASLVAGRVKAKQDNGTFWTFFPDFPRENITSSPSHQAADLEAEGQRGEKDNIK